MSAKNTNISKFLSYILRHKPESVGLTLNAEGWAAIDDIISCSAKEGLFLDHEIIQNIVDTSDKKRFTISDNGLCIRAAQGHSTPQVNINYKEKIPPSLLYHGTATRFMPEIREHGLAPMSRQYVHLSLDEETAIHVGQRHGRPVVLQVKSLSMHALGFTFFQADNGVWLTESVPYQFIQE